MTFYYTTKMHAYKKLEAPKASKITWHIWTLTYHHSVHIGTVSSWLIFIFGTFDSCLTIQGRNQIWGTISSTQAAHKSVTTSSARQATGYKSIMAESAWDIPFLNRKIFYFVIRFLCYIFLVINFSYLVIRFLLNRSIVKSNNEIGKVNDKKNLI